MSVTQITEQPPSYKKVTESQDITQQKAVTALGRSVKKDSPQLVKQGEESPPPYSEIASGGAMSLGAMARKRSISKLDNEDKESPPSYDSLQKTNITPVPDENKAEQEHDAKEQEKEINRVFSTCIRYIKSPLTIEGQNIYYTEFAELSSEDLVALDNIINSDIFSDRITLLPTINNTTRQVPKLLQNFMEELENLKLCNRYDFFIQTAELYKKFSTAIKNHNNNTNIVKKHNSFAVSLLEHKIKILYLDFKYSTDDTQVNRWLSTHADTAINVIRDMLNASTITDDINDIYVVIMFIIEVCVHEEVTLAYKNKFIKLIFEGNNTEILHKNISKLQEKITNENLSLLEKIFFNKAIFFLLFLTHKTEKAKEVLQYINRQNFELVRYKKNNPSGDTQSIRNHLMMLYINSRTILLNLLENKSFSNAMQSDYNKNLEKVDIFVSSLRELIVPIYICYTKPTIEYIDDDNIGVAISEIQEYMLKQDTILQSMQKIQNILNEKPVIFRTDFLPEVPNDACTPGIINKALDSLAVDSKTSGITIERNICTALLAILNMLNKQSAIYVQDRIAVTNFIEKISKNIEALMSNIIHHNFVVDDISNKVTEYVDRSSKIAEKKQQKTKRKKENKKQRLETTNIKEAKQENKIEEHNTEKPAIDHLMTTPVTSDSIVETVDNEEKIVIDHSMIIPIACDFITKKVDNEDQQIKELEQLIKSEKSNPKTKMNIAEILTAQAKILNKKLLQSLGYLEMIEKNNNIDAENIQKIYESIQNNNNVNNIDSLKELQALVTRQHSKNSLELFTYVANNLQEMLNDIYELSQQISGCSLIITNEIMDLYDSYKRFFKQLEKSCNLSADHNVEPLNKPIAKFKKESNATIPSDVKKVVLALHKLVNHSYDYKDNLDKIKKSIDAINNISENKANH